MAAWSPCLADAIEDVLDRRGFPLILGGDCTILPGSMLMSREELTTALRVAMASGKAVGLEVAIYNPSLDEDGSAGRLLNDVSKEVL